MKIVVTVTVDLKDPQQWADTYGTGTSVAEIREHVKAHVGYGVLNAAPFSSGEVDGEVDYR